MPLRNFTPKYLEYLDASTIKSEIYKPGFDFETSFDGHLLNSTQIWVSREALTSGPFHLHV